MFNYINTISGLDTASEPTRARVSLKLRLVEARRSVRRMQRILARALQNGQPAGRGLGQLQQYRHMV